MGVAEDPEESLPFRPRHDVQHILCPVHETARLQLDFAKRRVFRWFRKTLWGQMYEGVCLEYPRCFDMAEDLEEGFPLRPRHDVQHVLHFRTCFLRYLRPVLGRLRAHIANQTFRA